jgi:hypothetical protein
MFCPLCEKKIADPADGIWGCKHVLWIKEPDSEQAWESHDPFPRSAWLPIEVNFTDHMSGLVYVVCFAVPIKTIKSKGGATEALEHIKSVIDRLSEEDDD